MAGEIYTTVTGNLTTDLELRYTTAGTAVVNFTIASTPRFWNQAANKWQDGDTEFIRAAVWRETAEHLAASLQKGDRVIASGRIRTRTYTTKSGERHTVFELDVDEIGSSLRYTALTVARTRPRSAGGQQPSEPAAEAQAPATMAVLPADDPWANQPGFNEGQNASV